VTCRSCGHEIADNAIVCYKCGTPTDVPAPPVKPPATARRARWIAAPLVVAIIVLAVWGVPRTEAGSAARWMAWAIVAFVSGGALIWLRRR
jgi:hypothetical protein